MYGESIVLFIDSYKRVESDADEEKKIWLEKRWQNKNVSKKKGLEIKDKNYIELPYLLNDWYVKDVWVKTSRTYLVVCL